MRATKHTIDKRVNGSVPPNGSPSPGVLDETHALATRINEKLTEIRTLESLLVNRQNFSRLGSSSFSSGRDGEYAVSFGGKRDLYDVLGYPQSLTFRNYYQRYRRGGIAQRIVNIFPDALWTGQIEIIENEDPEIVTPFETAWESITERIPVFSILYRAHVLSLLGSYGAVLIGLAEGEQTVWSEPPATNSLRRLGPEALLYLTPLSEETCKIESGDLDSDPSSRRFGLPKYYRVDFANLADGVTPTNTSVTERVHYSRIAHVADTLLDSDTYALPYLEAIWNYLHITDLLLGAGGEASWRRMDPGLTANIPFPPANSTIQLDPALLKDFENQLEEYTHGLKRYLLSQFMDVEAIQTGSVNFSANADTIKEFICATIGVPWREVFGEEAQHLAGNVDKKRHDRSIQRKMERFGTPLISSLITRLIEWGVLPRLKTKKFSVVWPLEDEDSQETKIANVKALCEANKSSIDAGLEPVMLPVEMRDTFFGLEALELEEDDSEEQNKEKNMSDNIGGGDTPEARVNRLSNNASISLPRRIVLVGGPRRGKSSLAREFRAQAIPTYCTDPLSLVKDPESDVTYLPEGLTWSQGSEYVATNWFTLPGPWCIEGIGTVRALRKFATLYSRASLAELLEDRDNLGNAVEILYISNAVSVTGATKEQEALAKGVATVWGEVKDIYAGNTKYVDSEPVAVSANKRYVRTGEFPRDAKKPRVYSVTVRVR